MNISPYHMGTNKGSNADFQHSKERNRESFINVMFLFQKNQHFQTKISVSRICSHQNDIPI